MFEFFIDTIGRNGIVSLIGFLTFIFCLRYSREIFNWIENQTMGTKEYVLKRLEVLFIEFPEHKIAHILLFLSLGMGAIALILFGFLGAWFMGAVLAILIAFIGFKIPRPFVDLLVQRRIKAYQNQMVDGLTLLANGIRAGLSIPQALGMVVDEMPNPIAQEFGLILQQNRIGMPLEECFENLAKRMPTEDNDMFVSSINILRETGGNLAEVFDTIVGVIRERVRLQQKIDTYTAQGMFQGATIFCMPFAIGGIYALNDPASMAPLFTTPIGIVATIIALGLDILGGIIILKIVKIKI